MKPTPVKMTWYVVDAERMLIVDEMDGPADRPWIVREKAQKSADEYARKSGHSTIVVRPESYH